MRVSLAGLPLENPVLAASGTFGYGREFTSFYDINLLGSFCFKGTTQNPRFGNPTPRIAECESGILNAVGLQNPGIDAVIQDELPALEAIYRKKVIANISGFSVEEYVLCCRKIDQCAQVGIIEVNISCPNVHEGGMAFGTTPESAARITGAVRRATTKPVFIKLSPNVTDIASIALACQDAGADGISLINTVMGMRIDIKTRKPVLANGTGGLSGRAIFPIAVRMVHEVAHAVQIPIIGMGGICNADNVIEMMMAGATAVAIGTENLINPFVCKEIIEELPKRMESLGIEKLADIIGCCGQ